MERVLTISRCPDRLTAFDPHTEVDFSKRGSFYVEPGRIAPRRERDGVALPTGHVADRAEDQVALLTVVLDGALPAEVRCREAHQNTRVVRWGTSRDLRVAPRPVTWVQVRREACSGRAPSAACWDRVLPVAAC